jgi:hypothetical protein
MTTDCARRFLLSSVWVSFAFTTLLAAGYAQKPADAFKPVVPRTWDEQAFADLELPLAGPSHSPKHISADEYYRLPVRPICKSYPFYNVDREPPGYSVTTRAVPGHEYGLQRSAEDKRALIAFLKTL